MIQKVIGFAFIAVATFTTISGPPQNLQAQVSEIQIQDKTEIKKIVELPEISLSAGQGDQIITDNQPSQEEVWANRIDQYIAEYNPNISNQGCGMANGEIWVDAGVKYGNHPYFLVAIARADTSLGKGLTNKCNLGNTGHCDSCAKGHQYNSFANSIYSISQTLSNSYLGRGTLSCHFSVGGWQYCPDGKTINNGKFYASSRVNWNRNVNDTMAWLHGTNYQNDFQVKI